MPKENTTKRATKKENNKNTCAHCDNDTNRESHQVMTPNNAQVGRLLTITSFYSGDKPFVVVKVEDSGKRVTLRSYDMSTSERPIVNQIVDIENDPGCGPPKTVDMVKKIEIIHPYEDFHFTWNARTKPPCYTADQSTYPLTSSNSTGKSKIYKLKHHLYNVGQATCSNFPMEM